MKKEWEKQPWRLVPNKIVRYPGGREIDRFRGIAPAMDDGRPEAWVGSDTATFQADKTGDPYDGCARCLSPDGEAMYLFEALQSNPEGLLGPEHTKQFGSKLGVLVKLLDAKEQLGLQCHPSRTYAKEHFHSDFGKEESWYILSTRDDSEEPPYVLLGFREGVTRQIFEEAYDRGDVRAMEQCCHKVPVKPGDTFFIAAGLPHAVGCGCFMVEVQEPSDITVGWEKLPKGASEEEEEAHKQRLLGCYDYDVAGWEKPAPPSGTPTYLPAGRLGRRVRNDRAKANIVFFVYPPSGAKSRNLVAAGNGPDRHYTGGKRYAVLRGGKRYDLKKGQEWFFPYAMEETWIEPEEGREVSLILAKPAGAKRPV